MLHSFQCLVPTSSSFFTDKAQEPHATVPVAEEEQQTLTKCIRTCWKHHLSDSYLSSLFLSVHDALLVALTMFCSCQPNGQHKANFFLSSGYTFSLKCGPDIASASALCLYFSADCKRISFLLAAVTVLLQMGP